MGRGSIPTGSSLKDGHRVDSRRGAIAPLLIAFTALAVAVCGPSNGLSHPSAPGFARQPWHWQMDDRLRDLQQTLIAQYAGTCRDLGGLRSVTVKPRGRGVVATIRCASSTITHWRAASPTQLAEIRDLMREAANTKHKALMFDELFDMAIPAG